MRKSLFARAAAAALLLSSAAPAPAEILGQPLARAVSEAEMKASLRQIALVDESGARFDLSALTTNGRRTLVTLWAHWCPNCQAEMSGLRQVAQSCPDRWNVVFVSSRYGDYAKDLAKFKRYGLPWKLYNIAREMMETPAGYKIVSAFAGATRDGAVLTPLHYVLTPNGEAQMIVSGRMEFSSPAQLAAFCGA
jgi:thiol-disulfide isomerase/thioredoxin